MNMEKKKQQSWDNPRCEILKAMHKARPMSMTRCLTCKGGRLLCGRPSCPLLQKISIQNPIETRLKESMFGPSPSIFVGWKGYPNVLIGPMTAVEEENAAMLDDPSRWYGLDFDEIIRMRSSLVRSKTQHGIKERTTLLEKSQELAMSVKPTDTEVVFKSRPKYGMSFSPISQPMGPSGVLKSFEIAENPSIPKKVDYVVSDELKANDAIYRLYQSDYDVYYLSRILSSGVLGIEENRKLVPTRWGITAVDDIIANLLREVVKERPLISEFRVYSNTYLENHFEILLMPRNWEFEQFEAWAPDTLWTMAYSKPAINLEKERYRGRSRYAIKEGGGYYAARLAVLEALDRMKRQAGVVIFREIHEGYIMPVGVWEVRENVRNAFRNPPAKFDTMEGALAHVGSKLKIPLSEYRKRSGIISQKRLEDFN